jgi:hypothetical protein
MQKPKIDETAPVSVDTEKDYSLVVGEPVETDSNDEPTADANGDSDDERADENEAVPTAS